MATISDSESEMEWVLGKRITPRPLRSDSVRMKALMFEINFPFQQNLVNNDRDYGNRSREYKYGQKFTYLRGNMVLSSTLFTAHISSSFLITQD